ncbi:MAG: hypothetical protein HQK52_18280 [Oligoflexia bacterium]|nr:hypothetical protein [Oligoflexia bacterium]
MTSPFQLLFWPFVLLFCLSSQAAEICRFEVGNCDLVSDGRCLAKNYACGRYETVISALYLESFAPTTEQKYYLGASLYGLYIGNRAKSLQCEYAQAVKDQLSDFLLDKEERFRKGDGQFGTIENMNQIYHATQILSDLKKVEGCLESALTRSRVNNMAMQFALSGVKEYFITPSSLGQQEIDSITMALRGFVSKASEIETGLAMREIEIETGFRHLENIMGTFATIFGKVTRSDNASKVDVSLEVIEQLEAKSSIFFRDSKLHEKRFRDALGGVSPEEYSNLRTQTIIRAERMLKESSFVLDLLGATLPDPEDSQKPLWILSDEVNKEDDGRTIGKNLNDLHQEWKDFATRAGHCRGSAAKNLWYCKL